VHTFRFRWLPLAALGMLLACSGGLSGCGLKPTDGSVVEDGSQISAEQKAKVRGFYADRVKKPNKKAGRKK
jgi:hypothetical protein